MVSQFSTISIVVEYCLKENIEMGDSFIYYKLIYIHINSGSIQEFRQNLTDHKFTINKREVNIVETGEG